MGVAGDEWGERNKGSKIEKLLIEIIELFIPLQKRW